MASPHKVVQYTPREQDAIQQQERKETSNQIEYEKFS